MVIGISPARESVFNPFHVVLTGPATGFTASSTACFASWPAALLRRVRTCALAGWVAVSGGSEIASASAALSFTSLATNEVPKTTAPSVSHAMGTVMS